MRCLSWFCRPSQPLVACSSHRTLLELQHSYPERIPQKLIPQSKFIFVERGVEMHEVCSLKPHISPASCWIRAKRCWAHSHQQIPTGCRHTKASGKRNEVCRCHTAIRTQRQGETKSTGMPQGGGCHILSPCQLSSVSPSLPGSEVPALPPPSPIATLQQVSVYAICLTEGSWSAYKLISRSPWGSPSVTYWWMLGEGWINFEWSAGKSLSPKHVAPRKHFLRFFFNWWVS